MISAIRKTASLTLLMTFCTLANAADRSAPALSPAETAAITRQVATLKSAADRRVALGWSNS